MWWPHCAVRAQIEAITILNKPSEKDQNHRRSPWYEEGHPIAFAIAINFTTELQARPVTATLSDRSILPASCDRYNPSHA